MKVELVQVWQQKAIYTKPMSINRCCKLIDLQVSSYYAITVRQALPPKIDTTRVALKVAFMASGQTYGSRRLVRTLNNQGDVIGRYRVRTMMKAAQLVPVWKRRFVRTTDSKHTGRIAPNLLQQDFKVNAMNQVWVADITPYRSTGQALYSHAKWLAILGSSDGFICP